MGIMRKTLMQMLCSELPIPVVKTRGYITKATREKLLVLPKSHTNDALAIAQGKRGFNVGYLPEIAQIDKICTIRPVRHHNRQLHKAAILTGGIRKSNQAEKSTYLGIVFLTKSNLTDRTASFGEEDLPESLPLKR